MKPVIFISSHPIQYFAPMYQALTSEGLSLQVYYCSRHGLEGQEDKEFNTAVKWDIPLLSGYSYRFFKNYFTRPSIYHFFGLINPGIFKALLKAPKSVVVIHGWNYFSNILALAAAKLRGHTVCLRAETPLSHELQRHGFRTRIRKMLLKHLLFPCFNFFLYIGKQNKQFFEASGIPDSKLLFAPYAVDNIRFADSYRKQLYARDEIRRNIQIPKQAIVLLFSGKYIEKKRPLDLLRAFKKLQQTHPDVFLCMVGEGELRPQMEAFIKVNHLNNCLLTGFINQREIVQYYTAADVFIMCSGVGETWGLSVNEAMNFHLPLIVSDLTGCVSDLVEDGKNGYHFQTGNTDNLVEKLTSLLRLSKESLEQAGKLSADIVKAYSYHQTGSALSKLSCDY